jgi:hypothetical protein
MIATEERIGRLSEALAVAGTHTWDDVERGVAEGRFQKWGDDGCGIVTELLQTPLRRTLLFWLAGGNLAGLKAMVPAILQWGREQGCTHASFVGRFGWQRSFVRDLGFTPQAVMMETTL